MFDLSNNRSSWNRIVDGIADYLQPFFILLGLLLRPGEVIELRLLDTPNQQDAALSYCSGNGYFNDPVKLAATIEKWQGKVGTIGFTGNPVRRSLLSAAENQLRRPAGWIANGGDITRRCVLPISFQAMHETHAPASASLCQTSLDLAYECRDFLSTQGWPQPAITDSGKSIDLLYALDLPNSVENDVLIRQVLAVCYKRFSSDIVHTNTRAYAADVIFTLYGTSTSSADNRRSHIIQLPCTLSVVDRPSLEALLKLPVAVISQPGEPLEAVAGNSIAQFVSEQCEFDPDAWTPTGILYRAYGIFCYEYRLNPHSPPHFARNLIANWNLAPDRRKVRGTVIRGLWGVRLHHSQSYDDEPA